MALTVTAAAERVQGAAEAILAVVATVAVDCAAEFLESGATMARAPVGMEAQAAVATAVGWKAVAPPEVTAVGAAARAAAVTTVAAARAVVE